MAEEAYWALGLMSGTSLDGIDAALIRTDGRKIYERGKWLTTPLDEDLRQRIKQAMLGKTPCHDIPKLENDITIAHCNTVKELLEMSELSRKDIKAIGFHGQTIAHNPKENITWQLANGALMAKITKIDTVCDFRRRDIAHQGEGAPLVPLYHAALVRDMKLPIAIVNIGGISNVTWVGRSEYVKERLLAHDIMAFDTGAGNSLLDEWVHKTKGVMFDKDGIIASHGTVNYDIAEKYLKKDFFKKQPPKSLDKHDFNLDLIEGLTAEDGAATLSYLTAKAITLSTKFFPIEPNIWLISGGGRLNKTIMKHLREMLQNVKTVDEVGFEGDALEAQAFAFLAIRHIKRLPITLPTTTGTNQAAVGGAFYPA